MDDNIALVAAISSGGALALGLAAEAALFNYSQTKLEKMLGEDADRIASVSARLKNFRGLATALTLFNTFMVVVLTGAIYRFHPWDPAESFSAAGSILLTFAIVGVGLFGLVRGVIGASPERTLLVLLGFITGLSRILAPLVIPLDHVCRFIGSLFGASREEPSEEDEAVEDILDAVAEGEAEGVLEEDAADFIENIMEYRERVVREVMTPRTSVIYGNDEMELEEIVQLLREHGHSRLPVYHENRDNIVGILHAKDLLHRYDDVKSGGVALESLFRAPLFVPETKKISELLKEFKLQKVHIAVVLDEFGGTAGLITVEDIVEEIVGELEDEFDSGEDVNDIDRLTDNTVEVDAKIPIDYLNEQLAIDIPDDGDYDTIGGFLAAQLGKVPAKGENFEMEGVSFEVMDADERKVKRIQVITRDA